LLDGLVDLLLLLAVRLLEILDLVAQAVGHQDRLRWLVA
jgi:hypothetical protein